MLIDEIRIYSEVLEQGIDFKEYIIDAGYKGKISNIYTKKIKGEFKVDDSIIDRIRKVKDIDVLVTFITNNNEYPLLLIEYSTAVPTDDHRMQRSDVYFWSSIFSAPMMKISPSNKGMNQEFGGGNNLTDDDEITLAYNKGAIFFPIKWEIDSNSDSLKTKNDALSCIYKSKDILKVFKDIISIAKKESNYNKYYNSLKDKYFVEYKSIINNNSIEKIKKKIVESTRFHWDKNKLAIKINRFGHAMDPDRGVLYFGNMMLGSNNIITEIQINRNDNFNSRGGYKSLFDTCSKEELLSNFVKENIKNKNNVFSSKDAIYVLLIALNIEGVLKLEKINNREFKISDANLKKFLFSNCGIVSKSIFYLSQELILTDKNRDLICRISWGKKSISEFIDSIKCKNFKPKELQPLNQVNAKEDIITFSSVMLYKKIQCSLLAVSYPGAQGDRCILEGSGRKVLRHYVDIIAYKRIKDGIKIYLEECKDNILKSVDDVDKLNKICNDKKLYDGLLILCDKIIKFKSIVGVYKSIGSKFTMDVPNYDVDYIFMFGIEENNNKTIINYSVALINVNLLKDFLPLSEDGSKLKGKMVFDKIFTIAD